GKNRVRGVCRRLETPEAALGLYQQRTTPLRPGGNGPGEPKIQRTHQNRPIQQRNTTLAWTLIEMIGTLALVAILAGVLLPVLVRQTDKVVADQEVATLKSFRDAFQQ